MTFAQALFEGVVQFLPGQPFLAFLKITAHHRLVDLHDLINDALVRSRDILDVARAGGIEETIDHGRTVVGGQVDRQAFGAEGFAQLADQRGKLAGFGVDPIHHEHPAEVS